MKVKSEMVDEKIYFDNFVVVKESNTFWGVYEKHFTFYNKNSLITSGPTKDKACKKAKMLQIGYDMALNNARTLERERYYDD